MLGSALTIATTTTIGFIMTTAILLFTDTCLCSTRHQGASSCLGAHACKEISAREIYSIAWQAALAFSVVRASPDASMTPVIALSA